MNWGNNESQLKEHERLYKENRAEWSKLPPSQQMASARYMERDAKPQPTSITPLHINHHPDENFDRLIALKQSNPTAYQAEVNRMSASTMMSFSRYAENKVIHDAREAEAAKHAEIEREAGEKLKVVESDYKQKMAKAEAEAKAAAMKFGFEAEKELNAIRDQAAARHQEIFGATS